MAENFEMEGLEFEILGDTKQADSNLTQLIAKLEKLKNTLKGSGLNATNNQLAKLNNNLYQIKNSVAALNKTNGLTDALEKLASIKIPPTIAKRIGEITAAANTLSTDSVVHIQMLSEALKNLDGVKIGKITIPKVEAAQTAKETAAKATENSAISQNMQQVEAHTEQATESIKEFNDAVSESDAATDGAKTRFARFSEIAGSIKDRFLSITSGLKSLVSGLGKVGKTVASVTKRFLSFTKTLITGQLIGSKLGASTATFTSKLGKFFSSLKRIAFYRIIRGIISSITSGIKEGMTNLYYYSQQMGTQFAPNMDKLATSALYLKNSLGALTEPIVARLAPAVDLLVDKFVDLLNIVNQVISTLNGQDTYTAAKKYATSWAEAADGTKNAVNEIKRSILGFDELNVLTGNKDKGSSAAGNALDYSQMFEQRAISSSVKSFTDTIKNAFKQKEFEKLGRNIGNWINKGINKIPDVKIGVTIGNAINNINDYFYGMLDTLDTQTLGEKVGTNFTAAVKTIKWGNLGRTVGTYGNRLLDFWNGVITQADIGGLGAGLGDFFARAVETYNWGKLGDTVGIGFTKIAEFFGNLVEHAELGNLGSSLAEFINRALNSANWSTAGKSTAKVFNGIISFFSSLILNTEWKTAGGAVGTFLTNAFRDIKWGTVGKTVAGAVTGITDFFIGLFTNLDAGSVGKAIGDTLKGFFNHLSSWLKNLDTKKLGKEVPIKIVEFLDGLDLTGILGSLGTFLWGIIKKAFTFKLGLAEGILNLIIGTISGGEVDFDDIVNFGKKIGQKIWDGLKSVGLTDWIDDLKDGIDAMLEALGLDPIFTKKIDKDVAKTAAMAALTVGQTIASQVRNGIGQKDYAQRNIEYNQSVSNGYDPASVIKNAISAGLDPGLAALIGSNSAKGVTATVDAFTVSDNGKKSLKDIVSKIVTANNVSTLGVTNAARSAFAGVVAGQRLTGNVTTVQTAGGAIGNFISSVAGQRLTGNVTTVSPTSRAWSNYFDEVKNYNLTGTVSKLQLAANVALAGVAAATFALSRLATGGVVSNGHITSWNSIPKYAGGTMNAHGSLFVAGEAGAEIVGNVNGKTEILNKSQMAQAMYSATVAGMQAFAAKVANKLAESANAVISAITYTSDSEVAARSGGLYDAPDDNVSTLIDGVREGVYEATAQQNDLLRQQNEILLDILAKDNTAQISTNSVVKALAQKNRRDGKYVVPVGIT